MLSVVFEIVVFAGWANWCAPQVWLSFQPPFSQVFSSFRDTDWLCGQHLSHENGRIISVDPPEVHGLSPFPFRGLCWTCLFG